MSENQELVDENEVEAIGLPAEQVVDIFSGLDELDLTDWQRTHLRNALIAIASGPDPKAVQVRLPRKPAPKPTYDLACFRCGHDLEPTWEGSRDAWGGTTFRSSGNYGSTVFDPMSAAEELEVIICDGCLRTVARLAPHLVRLLKHAKHFPPQPRVEVTSWTPYEPETVTSNDGGGEDDEDDGE